MGKCPNRKEYDCMLVEGHGGSQLKDPAGILADWHKRKGK